MSDRFEAGDGERPKGGTRMATTCSPPVAKLNTRSTRPSDPTSSPSARSSKSRLWITAVSNAPSCDTSRSAKAFFEPARAHRACLGRRASGSRRNAGDEARLAPRSSRRRSRRLGSAVHPFSDRHARDQRLELHAASGRRVSMLASDPSGGIPSISRASDGVAGSRPRSRITVTMRSTRWAFDLASSPRR